MRQKYFLYTLILGFGIALSAFIVAGGVSAQTGGAANIQYPVPELGNCANEAACRTYCDGTDHVDKCLTFAAAHGLMSPEELLAARKFAAAGTGPGGCTGRENCNRYCDDVAHIDECISFAEKHGLIPPEELLAARKVQAAIRRGVTPPSCGGKQACDRYCSEPNHMEECITFGKEAGLMSPEEAADVDKVLGAVKRGVQPPPCRGKQACDRYCSEPEHMEACMTFAKAAGFMSPEEAKDAEKMLAAMKKGVKPPACRGKKECDRYCGDATHTEECIAFAEAAGFMKPEEAAMARRTGGKGPGGCRGKEACEAFCGNQANQETCFNFGTEHGLIPEEDVRRMEAGKAKFREGLEQAPPEIAECLKATVGEEVLAKLERGEGLPPKDLGEKMRGCFEKIGPRPSEAFREGGPRPSEALREGGPRPSGAFREGGPPQGEFQGPGGCASPEECGDDARYRMMREGGMRPPEGAGQVPFLNCTTPEECAQFRDRIPEEFRTMMERGVPPHPGESVPPPPSSFGPHTLLGLLFKILTGR